MTGQFSSEDIAQWAPLAKVAVLFLSAVIFEDIPAIGAGLLLATGDLSWPAAVSACFLGIWVGDTGLYGFARALGRGWFEKSSLRRFEPKVARSERWFAERGTPILIFSRMVPGARLPTYFAAGFLRLPWPRFLLVTGLASLAWTFVVLFLSRTFGAQLIEWLDVYKNAGLILILVTVGILFVGRLVHRGFVFFRLRQGAQRIEK